MGKPVNIASTAHAQHAELAAAFARQVPAPTALTDTAQKVEELETALSAANEHIEQLTAELAAERAAHMQLIADARVLLAEHPEAIPPAELGALLPELPPTE